ncbi:hypothetical protein D9M68_901710 [compost metagenome]
MVNGQEALIGVEAEMPRVVVGEVVGGIAVADDKYLHEAQQRAGEAVTRVVLVFDDLLNSATRVDAQRL